MLQVSDRRHAHDVIDERRHQGLNHDRVGAGQATAHQRRHGGHNHIQIAGEKGLHSDGTGIDADDFRIDAELSQQPLLLDHPHWTCRGVKGGPRDSGFFLRVRREPWKNEDARANDSEEMFDAVTHDRVLEEFFLMTA